METENIRWNEQGLIPVIVEDVRNNEVLMQAYMNEEALNMTLHTGYMVYYSRSRQQIWEKGKTSGQTQRVVSLYLDCDADCLLAKVEQNGGGACHTGAYSCFFTPLLQSHPISENSAQVLFDVARVINARKNHPAEKSYTNYLFDQGVDKICKKIGEESAEVIIAAKNASHEQIVYESADLLYHLLVLLEERGVALGDVFAELRKRQKS